MPPLKTDFEFLNSTIKRTLRIKDVFGFALGLANGLRYPRWGGRRNAVRLGKCRGVEKGLKMPPNPQRRVHALLAGVLVDTLLLKDKFLQGIIPNIRLILFFKRETFKRCEATFFMIW